MQLRVQARGVRGRDNNLKSHDLNSNSSRCWPSLLKNRGSLPDPNHNNNNNVSRDPIKSCELFLLMIAGPTELAIRRSRGRPSMLPLLDKKEDQINNSERMTGSSGLGFLRRMQPLKSCLEGSTLMPSWTPCQRSWVQLLSPLITKG